MPPSVLPEAFLPGTPYAISLRNLLAEDDTNMNYSTLLGAQFKLALMPVKGGGKGFLRRHQL